MLVKVLYNKEVLKIVKSVLSKKGEESLESTRRIFLVEWLKQAWGILRMNKYQLNPNYLHLIRIYFCSKILIISDNL